ncbi:MAG: hypothetical protein HGA44_07600 [Cellulomonadaceae bacterium]|nr:hypothetical protein [Cellulomonadaceae bacterium]
MSVAQASGQPVRLDPTATRRVLRAEKAELTRWRRLLRARLDLTVASFAPPEILGAMSWDLLPEAQLALPLPQSLHEVVSVDADVDRVALMRRLRDLDRELAAYGAELDVALEQCTEDLVADLMAPDRGPRPVREAR